MRIRGSHIVVVVIAALGGLLLLVLLGPSSAREKDTDDFIEEVRLRQEAATGSTSAGDMPSVETEPGAGAQLEVETTEFDMGVISNSKTTTKDLMVYNKGKRDLKISTIKTTCGCTVGTFNPKAPRPGFNENVVIPPGGKLPMKVMLDPFRIAGFYSHKTLTIYSSDMANPTKEIEVYSHIEPEYTLEPETLDFGTVEMGAPAVKKVRIRQASATPVKIKDVEITARRKRAEPRDAHREALEKQDPFTLELKEVPASEWKAPDRPEWDVTVSLAPSLPLGTLQSQFYILSDVKRVPKFGYTLKADVRTFFRVEPPILRVRDKATPGQEKVATATILSELPFTLEGLSITGKDLSVSTRPGDQPNTMFVDVNVLASAEPSLKTETISMKVKSGEKSVDYSTRVFVSVMK
ncbi:MAG: DUF1573 domain-containing protein [Candidatus Hydrogenedentales bacterium]|jgi:hypothetical protein